VINGPNVLFTMNIKTGEVKVVHRDNHWFGHVQFSPTDPDLCMFCHEGNWENVDRIWLINPSKSTIDASGNVSSNARIAFHRTEKREIAGHEFWQPEGTFLVADGGGKTKTAPTSTSPNSPSPPTAPTSSRASIWPACRTMTTPWCPTHTSPLPTTG
jgi:hypothetical protein